MSLSRKTIQQLQKENKEMKEMLVKLYRDISFEDHSKNDFYRFVEKVCPEEFEQDSIKMLEALVGGN